MATQDVQRSPDLPVSEEVRPIREQRLHERVQLQQLNQRLEFFIDHCKTKDREIRDLRLALENLQAKHDEQVVRLTADFTTKQRQWEQDIATITAEMARKDRDYDRMKLEYDGMKQELSAQQRRLRELEQENHRLNELLAQAQRECNDAKTAHDTMKGEHEGLKEQVRSKALQLESTAKTLDGATRELTASQARLKAAEGELTTRGKEAKIQCDQLQAEIDRLRRLNRDIQDHLQREFAQKLQDNIDQRERQLAQDKDEFMRLFKDEWDRKFHEKEEELHRLKADKDHLTRELRDVNISIKAADKQRADVEARCRQLEDEMARLRMQMDQLKKAKDLEIAKLRQEYQDLKDAYRRKELQYNEVMNVKIHLDQEINQYRKLLGTAETEMEGYESPLPLSGSRKRARMSTASSSSYTSTPTTLRFEAASPFTNTFSSSSRSGLKALDLSQLTGQELPLDVVSMDTAAGFFELGNTAGEAVTLRGLRLANADNTAELDLPDRTLHAEERVRVWVGKKASPNAARGDLAWKGNVWNGSSENCIKLLDARSNSHRLMTMTPDAVPERSKENCYVM